MIKDDRSRGPTTLQRNDDSFFLSIASDSQKLTRQKKIFGEKGPSSVSNDDYHNRVVAWRIEGHRDTRGWWTVRSESRRGYTTNGRNLQKESGADRRALKRRELLR